MDEIERNAEEARRALDGRRDDTTALPPVAPRPAGADGSLRRLPLAVAGIVALAAVAAGAVAWALAGDQGEDAGEHSASPTPTVSPTPSPAPSETSTSSGAGIGRPSSGPTVRTPPPVQLVPVPDVLELGTSEVRRRLEAVGLLLSGSYVGGGRLCDYDTEAVGQVPAAGTRLEKGASVSVRFALFLDETTFLMPDFTQMDVTHAVELMNELQLESDPVPGDQAEARVLGQSVPPCTKSQAGDFITLDVEGAS